MTLYAKWEKATHLRRTADGTGSGLWWLLGLGLPGLLLLLLLLLLLGRKTVHFETGCDSKVKDQKVKKGNLVTRPEQPMRPAEPLPDGLQTRAAPSAGILTTTRLKTV